jgi:hypothetical protein
MRPFEYGLGLITILISLALADMVMCFHRLLRAGPRVTWDGRVLVAAALVVLEIVRSWYAEWTVRDLAQAEIFHVFFVQFLSVIVLVLLAASSLPDEVGEHCDLSAFYESNRRYFWGLFALDQLFYALLGLFVFGVQQNSTGGPIDPFNLFRMWAPFAAYVLLAVVRVRVFDYALPLAIIAFYLFLYWNQSLTG